jgi:4-oxalocrotonate tautomerase
LLYLMPMPIANILILEGRTPEEKQALIRAVTTAIADSLSAKTESIRVIVQEIPREHWGIGGVSAKELGR